LSIVRTQSALKAISMRVLFLHNFCAQINHPAASGRGMIDFAQKKGLILRPQGEIRSAHLLKCFIGAVKASQVFLGVAHKIMIKG